MTSTCAEAGQHRADALERERRERERRQRGHAISRRHAAIYDHAPTRRTTPSNMPPEPVTGLCCLPRRATVSSTRRLTPSGSPTVASSCPEAGRVDVERLDVDRDLRLEDDLVAGVEPLGGLGQRPSRGEDAGGFQADRRAGSSPRPCITTGARNRRFGRRIGGHPAPWARAFFPAASCVARGAVRGDRQGTSAPVDRARSERA